MKAPKGTLTGAKGNQRWPYATTVQSLLFDKDLYTEAGVKKWIAGHPKFHAPKVEEGSMVWRVRQHPPEAMTRGTFRTITFGKGIRAVIAVKR